MFIDLLNKVRVGNMEDDVENILKARFIHESDENSPKDALHMYAENELTINMSEAVLNDLPGEIYTINATDKISDNCYYPLALIQAAQNQKQTNTGGFQNLLKLKVGAKIMLTINIDIQDRLINDQTGSISHIEFAQDSICKIFVKISDELADLKSMKKSYLER